jgi:hypothetical protein
MAVLSNTTIFSNLWVSRFVTFDAYLSALGRGSYIAGSMLSRIAWRNSANQSFEQLPSSLSCRSGCFWRSWRVSLMGKVAECSDWCHRKARGLDPAYALWGSRRDEYLRTNGQAEEILWARWRSPCKLHKATTLASNPPAVNDAGGS